MTPSSSAARVNSDNNIGGEPPTVETARPPFFDPTRGPAISGVSAFFLIVFGIGVVILARWAGQTPDPGTHGRTIQGLFGFFVSIALALLVLTYAWIHLITPSVAKPRSRFVERISALTAPFGTFATFVDHALVFGIANFCGAGGASPQTRTLQFLAFFGGALLVAYLAPAPWGLSGIVVALLGILGLNRKWAWVEEDRRRYVLSGAYDVSTHSNLDIGFEHNYRGAALSALALVIFVMPLALMQTTAFGFFELKDGGDVHSISTTEWFIFFGGEMAKSVPFVDWSEVYGAETVTPLQVTPGGGQHMVFFVRAVVDLILLAGLVQVLDLSGRLSRQEENFRDPDNPERLLDPFMERDAFRDIAKFVAPKKNTELDTGLVTRIEQELGPFTRYSNMQIQRVLWWGEAPVFWRPDHETAMAIILPHRDGNVQAPPQYFTRIITDGVISEVIGRTVADRSVEERTRIGAVISSISCTKAAFADIRNAALKLLPSFLLSSDERVWSGAACTLAGVRSDPLFPTQAFNIVERALSEADTIERAERSLMLHKMLSVLANTKRPSGDGEPRPHLDQAATLLISELNNRPSNAVLLSAINALFEVEFRPGNVLDFAQQSLAALHDRSKQSNWTNVLQYGQRRRLRRSIERCLTQISKYEQSIQL